MDEKQKPNQLENLVADHEMLMQNINKRLSVVENVGTILGILNVISAGAIIILFVLMLMKGVI